jgi:hypothetical protein
MTMTDKLTSVASIKVVLGASGIAMAVYIINVVAVAVDPDLCGL